MLRLALFDRKSRMKDLSRTGKRSLPYVSLILVFKTDRAKGSKLIWSVHCWNVHGSPSFSWFSQFISVLLIWTSRHRETSCRKLFSSLCYGVLLILPELFFFCIQNCTCRAIDPYFLFIGIFLFLQWFFLFKIGTQLPFDFLQNLFPLCLFIEVDRKLDAMSYVLLYASSKSNVFRIARLPNRIDIFEKQSNFSAKCVCIKVKTLMGLDTKAFAIALTANHFDIVMCAEIGMWAEIQEKRKWKTKANVFSEVRPATDVLWWWPTCCSE